MKTFKEYKILAAHSELKELLKKIISALPGNWAYKEEFVKEYAQNVTKEIEEIGCFESPEINKRKALVWFVIWDSSLSVVNIIPSESGSFSYDEYNAFLDLFIEECVHKHITPKMSVSATLGQLDIEKLAGEETFKALVKWEACCNHSTGNTHPMDFERWADFISTAVKFNSKLTVEDLERWLVEVKGWDKEGDLTEKIVLDYEHGLALIQHYVRNY